MRLQDNTGLIALDFDGLINLYAVPDLFAAPMPFAISPGLAASISAKPVSTLFTGANDDHGDTRAEATALTLGSDIIGKINADDDVDYFSFDLVAGQTVIFRGVGDVNSFTLNIETPDGTGGGNFGHGVIAFTATQTGTHFAAIDGALLDPYRYTSELGAVDIAGDSTTTAEISVGQSVDSQSDGFRDRDWFAFDSVAGDTVVFSVESEFFYQTLNLYDAGGNLVATAAGGFSQPLQFEFTTSDRFYVEVDLGNADFGTSYTLSAEASTDDFSASPTTTGALSLQSPATGVAEVDFDEDWFAVDVVAGQLLAFTISSDLRPADFTLGLTVYDADGNAIGSYSELAGFDANYLIDFDQGETTLYFDAATTGRIYLSATASGPGEVYPLAYTISAAERMGDVSGTAASTAVWDISEIYAGDSYRAGDLDFVSVELEAGEVYLFTVQSEADANHFLNLRGANGDFVIGQLSSFTDPDTGAFSMLVRPEDSGSFFISVNASSLSFGAENIAYTLSAEQVVDDHGNTAADATRITGDGLVRGVSEYSEDRDVFAIEIGENDAIIVRPDGAALSTLPSDDGVLGGTGVNNAIVLTAGPGGGTAYLDVRYNGFFDGLNDDPYSLSFERVQDEAPEGIGTNRTIQSGQTITGLITNSGDEDWYALDVADGEVVTFQVADFLFGSLTYGLYDASGTFIDAVPSGQYEATFNVGGRYYLAVSTPSNVLADYAISWFSDSMPQTVLMDPSAGTTVSDSGASSHIFGMSGNDIIAGQGGNDLIQTGLGRDRVQFGEGDGADIVTDFNVRFDRLELGVDVFTTRADLAAMMTDTAEGVRITLPDGSSILLQGVQAAELGPDQFIFNESDAAPDDNGLGPYWGHADYDYGDKNTVQAEPVDLKPDLASPIAEDDSGADSGVSNGGELSLERLSEFDLAYWEDDMLHTDMWF